MKEQPASVFQKPPSFTIPSEEVNNLWDDLMSRKPSQNYKIPNLNGVRNESFAPQGNLSTSMGEKQNLILKDINQEKELFNQTWLGQLQKDPFYESDFIPRSDEDEPFTNPMSGEKIFNKSFMQEDNFQLPPLIETITGKKSSYFEDPSPFGRDFLQPSFIDVGFQAIFD